MFIEYFNTQTNKLILLDESGNLYPDSEEIFFTAKRTEWVFDVNNPDFSSERDDLTDSDDDGLTDRFENLYGLNPLNSDTDSDGYSDFIEFSYGWDPFNRKLSPGQSEKVLQTTSIQQNALPEEKKVSERTEEKDDSIKSITPGMGKSPEDKITQETATEDPKNLIKEYAIKDKNIPDSSYLQKTLALMEDTFLQKSSFGNYILLFVSVFILGFLHATMPGHGKGILLSYLADKNRKFHHALSFSVTFTITHLIDVILLAAGMTLFSTSINSARISQVLKVIGGSGLIVIALM